MAIDTRNKRASCLADGLESLSVAPDPNGAVSAADRLQLAWLYAGLALSDDDSLLGDLTLLGVGA